MTRDIDRDAPKGPARDPRERETDVWERDPQSTPCRQRQPVPGRGSTCRISEAERRTLSEIGRFRTVAVEDLLRIRYGGAKTQMRDDLKSLSAQGLVQLRRTSVDRRRGHLDVLVLTRQGKDVLKPATDRSPRSQALYAGFVKPSEVAHDAAIYRMYEAEAARLEKLGGRVVRVVLDYELKGCVYSPLAKLTQLPRAEYAKRQAAVASQNHLKVVRGHVVLPDLRIEYETRDRELARVDLELATEHYHGSHLSAKAEAGFRIYAAEGCADRLSRVMDDLHIAADILSL